MPKGPRKTATKTLLTEKELKQKPSVEQSAELLKTLETRFTKNIRRHRDLNWSDVEKKLTANPAKLRSLNAMEMTGGEPDVVGYDNKTKEYIFFDCSAESPTGRRSICYDRKAWEDRKEHKPQSSVTEMAKVIGIELLTEEQYRQLQQLGEFDLKSSNWIVTPPAIRKLGGAMFADRRYDHVFVYHNGAESYYGGRGFRGVLKV